MVTPDVARRVISDAARLVKRGEIVVFGSASLAFWLKDAPRSRDVTVLVPHPHDVLVSRLGRLEPHDRDHVERILAEMPLDEARLDLLASESPYRTRTGEDPGAEAAFELHLRELRAKLPR